ncbi:hemolysin family protein [Sorangium sp. So ce426]|uniref:hemolysin family protein n=1 Tax=unclassified Sorangium TaxID=2621164 RepID=UPI003F5AE0BD
MTSAEWLGLGAVVVLISLAALMAAAEVVITRTSRIHAYRLREDGRPGAASLARVAESPAPYLNVVLLLTLLFHLTGTTIAVAVAVRVLGGLGEVIATLVMTVLLFVLAEASPKTFAVQHTDRTALLLAPLVLALGRILGPIARLLIGVTNVILPGRGLKEGPFVTEAEIRAMADVASKEAAIGEEEKRLIHSIFEFGDTVVREVMTPRPDIVAVPVMTPLPEAMSVFIKHGHSRIPVYDATLDDVAGVLYAKDVMRELHAGHTKRPLSEIGQKPHLVPESKRVAELLKDMQKGKFHMAIVVDEHGTVSGLVTLEDVIEEIVGEIADEYDREEPDVKPAGAKAYRVKGRTPVDRLSEVLDVKLPSAEWDTVGGLVLGVLGHLPAQGEQVEIESLRFTAERVHGRRISEVLVERLEPAEPVRAGA